MRGIDRDTKRRGGCRRGDVLEDGMGRLAGRGATALVVLGFVIGGMGGASARADARGGGEEGSYVSPTFGYELTWSDEWEVLDEASEGGYDYLELSNGVVGVYLEGFFGFDGDPVACVDDTGDLLTEEADDGEVFVAEDEDGAPIEGEDDGTAWTVYSYAVTYEDGDSEDLFADVQCWTLQEGASVLALTVIVLAEDYEDQLPAISDLVDGLFLPDPAAALSIADVEPFMELVEDDLTEFWSDVLAEEGIDYEEPAYVAFDTPIETACGDAAPEEIGPFYCPADLSVYLDLVDLESTTLPYGQFVVAIVIAHEVGHHLQTILGLEGCEITACVEGSRSLEVELQADCFAGVWAKDANERGLLEGGDLEDVVVATAEFFGDEPNTPASDPEAHGPGALRTWWLLKGYYEGVDACLTAIDPEEAGTD
jgi:hypothetical protein